MTVEHDLIVVVVFAMALLLAFKMFQDDDDLDGFGPA